MYSCVHTWLIVVFFLCLAGPAWGQQGGLDDLPKRLVPKQPPTRQEIQQRESLKKYAYGLLCEHEDKLEEALEAFEEAARLDPEAAAAIKAQVPILLAMGRSDDALKACQKVVELDPGDFSTWYVRAKLHKKQASYPDAIKALEQGVKIPLLKNHPESAQQMYFELGSLYEATEKFGRAADAYNKAALILEHPDLIIENGPFSRAAIDERAAETYEKIGKLYRKAKQYDQAITALRKAQKHAPERAGRLSFHLAELCLEQGNLKQALTDVEVYLRTQPLGMEAYEMKIDLLVRLKQTAGLVAWLEEAAQRDRLNSGLQLLLAKEYARAKQTAKAEQLYTKLAEESPSADLYRGLFHLYKDQGAAGMKRILTMLNKVIEKVNRDNAPAPLSSVTHAKAMVEALREDSVLAKELVKMAYGQVNKEKIELKFDTLYFLAMLAERHQKTEQAELFYRNCISGFNKDTPVATEYLVYNGLLRVLGKARKYEAIVEVCQKVLKNTTLPSLSFYEKLARALAALHRYDDALRNTDLGITLAGDDNKLYFKTLRVRVLTMADRFDDAETECKALLKAHEQPTDVVELRYVLSNIYAASKQHSKAEEQLQLILKIDPNNATVNNDLGYLWADQSKNLELAEAMIRKAIEQDRAQRRNTPNASVNDDKDNAAYVDSLGWVLFRRGQFEQARKELERAVALDDGDDPTIFEHLGDVYNRLDQKPEASRAWQRAVELYNQGVRRKEEERVRDLQRKIDEVKEEIGAR